MLGTKDHADCDCCTDGECDRSEEAEDGLYPIERGMHGEWERTALLLKVKRLIAKDSEGEVFSTGLGTCLPFMPLAGEAG